MNFGNGIVFSARAAAIAFASSLIALIPAQSETRIPTLTLHFPPKIDCGRVYLVQPIGDVRVTKPTSKTTFFRAQGDVSIPANQSISFVVSYLGLEHPECFDALKPANVLILNYANLENATNKSLVHLAKFPQLRHVTIEETDIDDEGLKYFVGLKHLNNIAMTGTLVKGPGLKYLAGLPRLGTLDVSRTDLKANQLSEIANLKHLWNLSAGGSGLMNAACANIAKSPTLVLLDVSKNSITNAGLLSLAALKYLDNLDVSETRITAQGMDAFLAKSSVRTVTISPTQFDPKSFGILQRKYPKIKFVFIGKGRPDSALFAPLH